MEKIFLKTLAELYDLEKDHTTWSIEKFEDNPPRLVRFQIIQSLSTALELEYRNFFQFGSTNSFQHLEKDYQTKKIQKLVQEIMPKHLKYIDFTKEITHHEIEHIFKHLFRIYLNFEVFKK